MSKCCLILILALVRVTVSTSYVLQDTYDASNFFDAFRFWNTSDPTHGFVSYKTREQATSAGLIRTTGTGAEKQVYIGVDTQNKYPTNSNSSTGGRPSVRLESRALYNRMLMVADIEHMPTGCGAWPALWTYGNVTWPDQGEIDILEGVNSQTTDWMTLHTTPGCSMRSTGRADFFKTNNCNANEGKDGCPQKLPDAGTPGFNASGGLRSPNYGPDFNRIRGGAYIMEWTSEDVNIWFMPRDESLLFRSFTSGAEIVDTLSLGTPMGGFSSHGGANGTTCDIDKHFYDHVITIDTTFCGDWAGNATIWESDALCSRTASTCEAFVAGNPKAFEDAYWLFNSINVYTTAGPPGNTTRVVDGVRGQRGQVRRLAA